MDEGAGKGKDEGAGKDALGRKALTEGKGAGKDPLGSKEVKQGEGSNRKRGLGAKGLPEHAAKKMEKKKEPDDADATSDSIPISAMTKRVIDSLPLTVTEKVRTMQSPKINIEE